MILITFSHYIVLLRKTKSKMMAGILNLFVILGIMLISVRGMDSYSRETNRQHFQHGQQK